MTNMNMQPLPGQLSRTDVLYVDLSAGHAAIEEAAEHRFFMLEAITKILSVTKSESFGERDQANLCQALNTLIEEAHALHVAAYHLALAEAKGRERG